MKRRVLFVLVCVAALLVVAAPAAQASGDLYLYDISPNHGGSGELVNCVIQGNFYHPINHLNFAPEFSLRNGSTVIPGTTHNVAADGSYAIASFYIPVDAPAGLYDLHASQTVGLLTYTYTRMYAFQVVLRPVITGLDPMSAVAGSGELKLVVKGFNFVKVYMPLPQQSELQVNGSPVATTYESSTRLSATLPASLLASVGTLKVVVVTSGTKTIPEVWSNTVDFPVKAPPAPVVSACSPTTAWAGYVKNDVVLTVTGSNFISGSHIMFGATEKTNTTFVSGTQLTVPLTAADLATAGTVAVGVKNPPFPPGTPSAATVPFAVQQETTTPVVTIAGATDGGWYNAAVPLTFTATDGQSGVQKIQYMAPPAVTAWTAGTTYTVPAVEGPVTVSAQALDWCNLAGNAGITVHIDTSKPGTRTLGNATVKKGNTAKLKFSVSEPASGSPTVNVTLKIARSNGTVVKTIPVANVPVNSNRSQAFVCNLAKGTYRWSVYAVDLAGNEQANVATAKLTVK
jgi:hypothetical protein